MNKKMFDLKSYRPIAFFSAMLFALAINAVPAKPGQTRIITLADGTAVTARLVGDEFGHYWLGSDGHAYHENSDGIFQKTDRQSADERAKVRRHQSNIQRGKRLALGNNPAKASNFIGKKKGIIIIVNFKDVAMKASHDNSLYNRIANEKNFKEGLFKGSVSDYFYDQSEGKFDLEFDVVGPVTVSKRRSHYGANDSSGNDKYPASMVIEACRLADPEVNFADYDWDGDNEVDQVFVIYAGKGEADGGASNTIWPHEWTLSSASFYGDGSGAQTFDGVTIDTYACGAELNGSGDIDGIGTICHEFSHCLGYPDFYDIDYSGGQGMGYWDLMDSGSYNGNGYIPSGYTSYERWVAGWMEPTELEGNMSVTDMLPLQEKAAAYIIYNDSNPNEYFLLENRSRTGWDAELPGKGLLILHVDYDWSAWNNNSPNDDPRHQRMTWIPADNTYQYIYYQGSKNYTTEGMMNDPFPYGSINSFGKDTTPAAQFYNTTGNGTHYMDFLVSDIEQNDQGLISFRFKDGKEPDPEDANVLSANDFSINLGHDNYLTVTLSNNVEVNAVQFDFTLPEGISIAMEEDGECLVETTARSYQLDAICKKMDDGKYRVVLSSTEKVIIEPGDGAILKIKVTCPTQTTPGTYEVAFSNIFISRTEENDSVNENGKDFNVTLTVNKASRILGDVNGDYEVNITDVLAIVDYVLDRPIKVFLFPNADMDQNGEVNITDALKVVDIILGRNISENEGTS